MTNVASLSVYILLIFINSLSHGATLPHVLMLVIDDLGYKDLSYHGSEIPTPNLDNLAREGIDLVNYYVFPVCTPTRSSFMTGRAPWRIGFQQPMTMAQGTKNHIPYDQPTLPELMKKAGYNTQMIGKWHLGFASLKDTPIGRGFNNYYGYYGGAQDYYTHIFNEGYDFHTDQNVDWSAYGHYSADLYFNYFYKFLETNYNKNYKQPLFMYFAAQTIHAPIIGQTPPNNNSHYNATITCDGIDDLCRRTYCKKVAYFDSYVGQLIDMFKELNLWNDTLMIVTTDNGGMPNWNATLLIPNEYNLTTSCGNNYPMRGGKVTMFQGGAKGLAFVTGGSNVFPSNKRGTVSDNMYISSDWLPSIVGGIAEKNNLLPTNLDGLNIIDSLFYGGTWTRNTVFIDYNFDAIQEFYVDSLIEGTVISDGWKYIYGEQIYNCWYPAPPEPFYCLKNESDPTVNITDKYLFNLREDPNEEHNLILQYPERADYLALLIVNDAIENGWEYNYINLQWNASCPRWHNGSWTHWIEDEPSNDIPVDCRYFDDYQQYKLYD